MAVCAQRIIMWWIQFAYGLRISSLRGIRSVLLSTAELTQKTESRKERLSPCQVPRTPYRREP